MSPGACSCVVLADCNGRFSCRLRAAENPDTERIAKQLDEPFVDLARTAARVIRSNPICPTCDASDPIRAWAYWLCRACGRTWGTLPERDAVEGET